MRIVKLVAGVATVLGIGSGLLGLAEVNASPRGFETESVYTRSECESLARQYRDMGYSARCYLTRDYYYLKVEAR